MSGFVKIAIDDYYSDSNWTTIINKYWLLAERVSDPRVQGWFLFDTPLPTLAMVVTYLALVMVVGPAWMAGRKAYKIQSTLVGYNALQVLLSSYMFYEHLMSGWWGDYSLSCQPVDYSDSEKARRMLHLCWVYYFSKLSEFADTIFFVLRKKRSQITWLHLYHHSLTPFEAWLLVKFIAGGHGTFSNIVNNLVHVIMYGYYMMSAMGPQYQKYLWWKKHLTTLQLIQFFMVLFHSISALVYDCGYPKLIASGLILHSTIFIALFMNFYIQAYKPKPKKTPVETNNNNEDISYSNGKENGRVTCNGDTNIQKKANGEMVARSYNVISNENANGHVIVNGVTNGYVSEKINNHYRLSASNGFVTKNGDANGHLRSEDTNSRWNGEEGAKICIKPNGVANGSIKTNDLVNGYANSQTPNGLIKEKVQ